MLTQTAEYALRAVSALAARSGLVPTSELARATGVPPPYLAKVLQQLASAELIRGRRGVGGGYRLVRSPDDISLFDVVQSVTNLSPDATTPAAGEPGFDTLEKSLGQLGTLVRAHLRGIAVSAITQDLPLPEHDVPEFAGVNGSGRGGSNGALEIVVPGNGVANGAANGASNGVGYGHSA